MAGLVWKSHRMGNGHERKPGACRFFPGGLLSFMQLSRQRPQGNDDGGSISSSCAPFTAATCWWSAAELY
jgi:hypothetical protein